MDWIFSDQFKCTNNNNINKAVTFSQDLSAVMCITAMCAEPKANGPAAG